MASPETKICKSCKAQFVIEQDDFSFYEKMGVPPPALCSICRFKRRAQFRNERTLYGRTCDLCKASVVTMYSPNSPYTVYCNDCWASDKWDAFSYGTDVDSGKSFFEQLRQLTIQVPKSATYSSPAMGPNINSEYSNFAGANKNCYLIFNSGPGNEDCAYARGLICSRNVFDTYYGNEIERVYEGINVNKSRGVAWGQNVSDSVDSYFMLNCVGCTNCFGCVNLRHKSYQFFNEQLKKSEWEQSVSEIMGSYIKVEQTKRKFDEHSLKFPMRENTNLKSVNSSGNYILESKNCHECFEVAFCEDLKYAFSVKVLKDSYDILGHGRNSELLLEGVGVGVSTRVLGSWWVENGNDIEYSFATRASEHCFGCDGIKNGKYCILNKKYNKDEYHALREEIVKNLRESGEYGLFAPPSLAFFGYNETVAQDNFPLAKEDVLREGFRWEDDIQKTQGQETMKSDEIPDHIKDVSDTITNEVLACIECGRNYKIVPMELAFYQTMTLPLPRTCFNCRFLARIGRRGPFTLHERKCDKCGEGIMTTYAPERPEIVYCESCYQHEVI